MLPALSDVGRRAALLPLLLATLVAPAVRADDDDRQVLQRFAVSGEITSRRLQEDLARSSWSPQELRAALVRAYGLKTTALGQYLATPAAAELLQRQLPWWSVDLAPQLRLAALRAAVVDDSRDGSLSLLGVVERMPVAFVMASGDMAAAAGPTSAGAVCGCPQQCGRSSLAHLAFLIACLQAGATAPASSSLSR